MVPSPGDTIYVPNIEAGMMPGKQFNEQQKRGGVAQVGRVLEVDDSTHFIGVTNFGGLDLPWEGYLEDLQEPLKEEIGIYCQAGLF